ncbi:uncharacterized protein EI90DRAFT_55326 [Cantharellus anzutake]|uniref:uncharacterized protein n=1 Tax=Cantharellus anzutake TaxID=1750568 RepID=UPI00190511E1|nr:uncharacterized protein EI90DRAFT_55326 [Cantharellus anzutake]KAF8344195.1 hypothetical protein EI90DRAFT_55326 [Cantharellus anzutake]
MSRPRSSLPYSLHASITSCLEAIERVSEQQGPLITSMQTELAVLDRLYCKFNNQHRSAVFLRRAVEARRILKRIQDSRGLFSAYRVYASFFGDSKRCLQFASPRSWPHPLK